MRRISLLALVSLLALALCATVAQARPVAFKAQQPREKVVRYWTAERMQKAIPAERARQPLAKGGGKGGGGGGTTDPAKSIEVSTPYPSAHGKVFFSQGTTNYVCSGTAVTSANESVVWTAGHCVHEGRPGATPYTNFAFVPAYRNGERPYGTFAATTLLTPSAWASSEEWGVDLGAAVVGRNAAGQTLSGAVAERPLVFNSARNQSYSLFGYPAAKKFSGQLMRVCNTAWSLADVASPPTMGVPCDMTGGSSGGGWVTSTGAVASVVSYGYSNLRNVLFGPYQGSEAQALFNLAAAQ